MQVGQTETKCLVLGFLSFLFFFFSTFGNGKKDFFGIWVLVVVTLKKIKK